MHLVIKVAVLILAYLIGSIPTSVWIGRGFYGIDIREHGSGNAGSTNAMRILGWKAGIVVLIVDMFKGWLAVNLIHLTQFYTPETGTFITFQLMLGVAAILGHNYTCWLYFKGGKGIATSAGVLIALVPWALLIGLGVWVILFVATRYVSVASMGAAFALPFATWFTTARNPGLTAVTGVLAALAIYQHRRNLQRLLAGTEHRIEFRKKEVAP